MSDGKGIVLNRMYTGSYLSSNLGHEVINMFQADNGKHYLYLNSKGNFSKKGENVGTMLLVRGVGDKRVEIVGLAKNLIPIESAQCTLPRDLGRVNRKVQKKQLAYMEGITYGGVRIKDIFGDKGQQSVYISYETDHESFYRPKRRIIINFGSEKKIDNNSEKKTDDNGDVEIFLSLNFASTSLHQYVSEDPNNDDWNKLQERCNTENKDLWMRDNTQAIVPEGFSEHQESLFDICRIQDDENRFSNALSYFIEKYSDIWMNYLQTKLSDIKLSRIDSVSREEDAKVENDKVTGGRIDLLIRTPECYIVIENKIDSGIIIEDGVSQIQRYYNYVKWLKFEAIKKLSDELVQIKDHREERAQQYDSLKYKEGKRGIQWKNELAQLKIQIDELEKELSQLEAREFRGFVLSPDYNKPKPKDREVDGYTYEELLYSDIYHWLKKHATNTLINDPNFQAFHNAMKKHTYAYENQALYEDMKNTFFTRIQKCPKVSSNTKNNA